MAKQAGELAQAYIGGIPYMEKKIANQYGQTPKKLGIMDTLNRNIEYNNRIQKGVLGAQFKGAVTGGVVGTGLTAGAAAILNKVPSVKKKLHLGEAAAIGGLLGGMATATVRGYKQINKNIHVMAQDFHSQYKNKQNGK